MESKIGKFDDISLSDYHKMPGWSKTTLDKVNKSIAHYQEWVANPPEQTAAMAFGSALHCAVLTPELYQASYVIAPKCDRRTKDGKAAYELFLSESAGKTAISAEDAGKIERMKAAIFEHPLASQLFSNGEAEQSFFWIDPKTGLQCKARPDYLRFDEICVDLKTCDDAQKAPFQKSIANFRYDVQGAFFTDGIFHSTGIQCSTFFLLAIEKDPPFGIMPYYLSAGALEDGRNKYEDNLFDIVQWNKNPEAFRLVYPESENPIEIYLPSWAK